MKKIYQTLFCVAFIIPFSNAQQKVWEKPDGYQIRQIVSTNNNVFYSAYDDGALFVTTGNENSATLLGNFDAVTRFTVFGNKVVFIGRKGYDINIWITDGTLQGTTVLTDFEHGSISDIAVFKGKIYFTNYNALYYSDGTAAGTDILLSLPYEGEIPKSISLLNALEDKLVYYYYGQLMVTDGNSSEVKALSDNTSAPVTGIYSGAATVNNKLIFIKYSDDAGNELWVTDGTDANTFLLKDINPGTTSGIETIDHVLKPWFTSSNGKLYFVANKGTGRTVWVTDGTANGTSELNSGAGYYNPEFLKSIDGNVYFRSGSGNGVYFSDGLNNIVQDIQGTQNPAYAYDYIKFNGSVYFVASDTDHGYELWKTENTAESTVRITDICSGTCSAFNSYTGLTVSGDFFIFLCR